MLIEIVTLQLLFSASTPLNKILLAHASVLTLIALRMLVAGIVILYSYKMVTKKPAFSLDKKDLPLFGQKIIFGSYLKYVLKYWGLQYITPTHMAFLFYTTPLFAAFYDYYHFEVKLTHKQLFGFCIAAVGTLPLLLPESISEPFFGYHLISLPSLAVLLAVAAHCYGVICTKKLVHTYHYHPLFVSGCSNLATGILALCTGILYKQPLIVSSPYRFIPYFFALITISNIVGKTWHINLLKKHSTTTLALAEYLNPFFIALYSYCMWGTQLTVMQCFSGVTILIGLTIISTKKVTKPSVTLSAN